jgi:20S proteasome alpha/beta subunit
MSPKSRASLDRIQRYGDRRMTYIAAFQCREGIVMCADTQETYGDHKSYVEKLVPTDSSTPLAIGGAGVDEPIEALTQEITERIWNACPDTKEQVVKIIKESIAEVWDKDMVISAAPKQYRTTELLVGVKPWKDDFCILRVKGKRVYFAPRHGGIIGYGTQPNYAILRRLYRNDLSLSQGVLLATYLVAHSKAHDDGVGFDTRIVVIRENGAWQENVDFISGIEKKFVQVHSAIDRLLLASPDLTMTEFQFSRELNDFKNAALSLRNEYRYEVALKWLQNDNDPSWRGDSYFKLPAGVTVSATMDATTGKATSVYNITDPDHSEALISNAGPKLWVHLTSTLSLFIDGTNHTIQKPILNLVQLSEWEVHVQQADNSHNFTSATCNQKDFSIRCTNFDNFEEKYTLGIKNGKVTYMKDEKDWDAKVIAGHLIAEVMRPLLKLKPVEQIPQLDSQKSEDENN